MMELMSSLITELVRLGQRNGITNDPSSLGALWKNINEGVVLGPGNKASDIPEVTAARYVGSPISLLTAVMRLYATS
jgi:hypothetical protein